ncbi:MAG: hypothetical protein JWM99_4640, partial [Verrucomicrobiales bacterium]|nr:hypothetical protein [Verrucomicrobiales bacterium]
GFFSSVVVEEQTPSPDRQKLSARLTGVWKPTADRKALEAAQPVVTGVESRPGSVSTNNPVVLTANSNRPTSKVQVDGVHVNTFGVQMTNSAQTTTKEIKK